MPRKPSRSKERVRGAPRASAAARGYGRKWQEYSANFLAEHPDCAGVLIAGKRVHAKKCQKLAECVDHIQAVTGPDDKLFWEPSNHQALSINCNTMKGRRVDKFDGRRKPAAEPGPASTDPLGLVMHMVLSGASERDIIAAIAKIHPDADMPALLAAVMADLEKKASCSPVVLIGWCFEATRELYRRMVEISDFPGALRAVKQVKELSANVFEREDEDDDQEAGDAEAGGAVRQAQGSGEADAGAAVKGRP